MKPLGWFMAGAGMTAAAGSLALIGLDVLYVQAGATSISEKVMAVGYAHPFVAALVGAAFGAVLGAFLGHYFLPQYVQR